MCFKKKQPKILYFFYMLSSLSEAVYQMSIVCICYRSCDFFEGLMPGTLRNKGITTSKMPLPSAELHNDPPSDFPQAC